MIKSCHSTAKIQLEEYVSKAFLPLGDSEAIHLPTKKILDQSLHNTDTRFSLKLTKFMVVGVEKHAKFLKLCVSL